jgi:uncharacterized surface protein with fasciclin (FAS1) repeats
MNLFRRGILNMKWFVARMLMAAAVLGTSVLADAEEKKDVVDKAVSAGSFKTLVAALKAADLVETLKGEGPFTIFAPTDAAFAKLPKGPLFDTVGELLKPQNKDKLAELLKDHVVSGKLTLGQALDAGDVATLRGSRIPVKFADGRVLIGPAGLLEPEIAASNGVIHVIDQVLLPKTWGESNVPRIGPFPFRYGKLTSFRYAYCPAPDKEQQNAQKLGAAHSCNACHVLPAANFPEMRQNLYLGIDTAKKDAELANPNLFRWVKSGRNAMFGKTYAVMDLGQKYPAAPVTVKVGQAFDVELYTFINQEGARWHPGARPRISGEEEEGFSPYGPNKTLPEITAESVVREGEISKLPLSGKAGETYDVCYSDSKFGDPTAGAFFSPDEKFGTRTTCGKYLVRYRAVKAGMSEIRWQLYRPREDGKGVYEPGLDYFAEYVLPVKVE